MHGSRRMAATSQVMEATLIGDMAHHTESDALCSYYAHESMFNIKGDQ